MTIQYFRLLLVTSIVIGLIGGCIDQVFPALLSETFHQAQEAHYTTFSMPHILFLGGSGVVLLLSSIATFYGLYMLKPWAPRLSLFITVMALLFSGVAGTYAQSGIAIAVSYLASYLWGAVLVFAFFSPFSAQFQPRND